MGMNMATTTANTLTIAEFDKLDLPKDRDWELHEGELVEVTFPTIKHKKLQARVTEMMKVLFPDCLVMIEFPFQLMNSNDKRSADVAVIDGARDKIADQQGILNGTPDMVIEVLSPSNSLTEMRRYRQLCLRHDTQVFWIVDPKDNSVEVYLKDGTSAVYESGATVPLSLLGFKTTIAVDAIFAGITTEDVPPGKA